MEARTPEALVDILADALVAAYQRQYTNKGETTMKEQDFNAIVEGRLEAQVQDGDPQPP